MSGAQAGFKQDLPPKGGYGPINWARVPGKKRMSGYAAFGIFFGVTTLAWIGYYFEERYKRKWILEMNDARLAISPLLLAEEQRLHLKHLRANRDEENALMKNVPGWETGKLNGEPVYHNLNNRFPVVHPEAYYAHAKWNEMFDRYYKRMTY
jgi:NADH dehydrogenase (ubiquinone) 1 alpha subcomplex subunit 13